mmetsp:Transcript_20668/g.61629  ORF Transcript_20668/g.61629 Transcript_20668/m.61629 type:complete len:715 (+) Transcript_20668:179-2323(+)
MAAARRIVVCALVAARAGAFCSDRPSDSMVENGKTCGEVSLDGLARKCNAQAGWIADGVCRQTCWDAGFPYDGDNCDVAPVPVTPQPTPGSPQPSPRPTAFPTPRPSFRPSYRPTYAPTLRPTTYAPTYRPTSAPSTYRPTYAPTTYRPTYAPTTPRPSRVPTPAPSVSPRPTEAPTYAPSPRPSYEPTYRPTDPRPTAYRPTYEPTRFKPTYPYQPTPQPTAASAARAARLSLVVTLEDARDDAFTPEALGFEALSFAVAESSALVDGAGAVAEASVAVSARRRLANDHEAVVSVAVDVDACARYGYASNDACLGAFVDDLAAACASGDFVDRIAIRADEVGLRISPRLACEGVGSAAWEPTPPSKSKKKKEEVPYGAYVFLVLVAALLGCCCLGWLVWYCVRDRSGGEAGYRAPKRLEYPSSSHALDDFGADVDDYREYDDYEDEEQGSYGDDDDEDSDDAWPAPAEEPPEATPGKWWNHKTSAPAAPPTLLRGFGPPSPGFDAEAFRAKCAATPELPGKTFNPLQPPSSYARAEASTESARRARAGEVFDAFRHACLGGRREAALASARVKESTTASHESPRLASARVEESNTRPPRLVSAHGLAPNGARIQALAGEPTMEDLAEATAAREDFERHVRRLCKRKAAKDAARARVAERERRGNPLHVDPLAARTEERRRRTASPGPTAELAARSDLAARSEQRRRRRESRMM